MRRLVGFAAALAVVAVVATAPGCGGGDPAEPLARSAERAREAQALSSLQQALVAAGVVRAESGGGYGAGAEDLAGKLQSRDPSKRFAATPSSGPDQVQVAGGGAGPVLLVVRSTGGTHLGAWTDGSVTLYYRGEQAPPYTAQQPAGAGWSQAPPG